MKNLLFYRLIFFSVLLQSCSASFGDSSWEVLFNGSDLSGWDTYVGPAWTQVNDSTFQPAGVPLGLNKDPDGIFSVVDIDNEKAIRISGEQWGGISTQQEFENYHLKLEFKWGELKFRPKDNDKRDSGLLYHAVGSHGADFGFWMRSQEFQVQEGDCGDYWGVAGGGMEVRARKIGNQNYIYDPTSELVSFHENSPAGRHCTKNPDMEKPSGEWNTLELICRNDTAIHVVNGIVTMVLYNSRQLNADGSETPLAKGKIQIQSEGAEVFYRNIKISPIKEIPSEFLQ